MGYIVFRSQLTKKGYNEKKWIGVNYQMFSSLSN